MSLSCVEQGHVTKIWYTTCYWNTHHWDKWHHQCHPGMTCLDIQPNTANMTANVTDMSSLCHQDMTRHDHNHWESTQVLSDMSLVHGDQSHHLGDASIWPEAWHRSQENEILFVQLLVLAFHCVEILPQKQRH